MTLVLRGGEVTCPATGFSGAADVIIDDGRVVGRQAPGGPLPPDAQTVDVDGCALIPAGVDVGTTLRDPGREEEEPLATLLDVAALGGYGTLTTLPWTSPPIKRAESVARLLAQTPAGGPQLAVLGCLTDAEELADLGEMTGAGARGFSAAVGRTSDVLLRHALEYCATFNRPALLVPSSGAEVPSWVMGETKLAARLGLAGRPIEEETIAVFRAIELTRLSGARTVIGPISCSRSLALVAMAKEEGLPVGAFVHALSLRLDETEHQRRPYDTRLRSDPPLPTPADREALLKAAQAGAVFVGSGHRPVSPRFKEVEMARAEPGTSTLGSTLALLWSAEGLNWSAAEVAQAISHGPAAALGQTELGRLDPGAPARIAVLDRRARTVVAPGRRMGRVGHHPLEGTTLPGGVRGLVVGGAWIAADHD